MELETRGSEKMSHFEGIINKDWPSDNMQSLKDVSKRLCVGCTESQYSKCVMCFRYHLVNSLLKKKEC